MKKIKVVKPLKSSQTLREEASQSTLNQPKNEWKPPAKSGWGRLPSPAALPNPDPEPIAAPVPTKPIAYSAPSLDETPAAADAHPKYLTGSDFAVTKMPLPKGMYVVIGLTIVDLILSLFRSTDNGIIFTLVMFLDLIVCVGLLLKLEFVRRMLIVVSVATIAFAGVELRGLMLVNDKIVQQEKLYVRAVEHVDKANLSVQQRSALAAQRHELDVLVDRQKHATKVAYVGLILTAIVNAGQIVYVMRPKVRAVFETLKT